MLFLRRAAVFGPLASAVVFLAHAVLFGHAHAMGGSAEGGLLGTLAAALLVLFLGAASFRASRPGSPRRPGAFPSGLAGPLATLPFAAAAGLGLLEASEGHGLGILSSPALLVVIPAALVVALAAWIAARCAVRLGDAIARVPRGAFERVVRLGPPAFAPAPVRVAASVRRGRAPPR